MLIQVFVIRPASPSASANAVNGMRQRYCVSVNHFFHMPWADINLSSRALLTGFGLLGLPVLRFTECRGKPQVMASSNRSSFFSRMTNP